MLADHLPCTRYLWEAFYIGILSNSHSYLTNQHMNHIGAIVPIYGPEQTETRLKFELGVSDSRICVVSHYTKLLLDIWFLFLFHKDSEGQ